MRNKYIVSAKEYYLGHAVPNHHEKGYMFVRRENDVQILAAKRCEKCCHFGTQILVDTRRA